MNIPWLKTGDKILIATVTVLAAVILIWNILGASPDPDVTAVITQDGRIIKQLDLLNLNEPEYLYLTGTVSQVIVAERGRIRFLESDCPNRTCVNSGWLTRAGDRAVCVPSRVVIKIVGKNPEMDTRAY